MYDLQLQMLNRSLTTEKENLERENKSLKTIRGSLNRTLEAIFRFSNLPVNMFCPVTKSGAKERRCSVCQVGWKPYNSSCYYVYLSSPWNTWSGSRQECIKMGADLVTIDSEDEQRFISELATNYYDKWHGYWIGLRRSSNGWFWVNGDPLTTGLQRIVPTLYATDCPVQPSITSSRFCAGERWVQGPHKEQQRATEPVKKNEETVYAEVKISELPPSEIGKSRKEDFSAQCKLLSTYAGEQLRGSSAAKERLQMINSNLTAENADLEREMRELKSERDTLNRKLEAILQFSNFPVKKYCTVKNSDSKERHCSPCPDGWKQYNSSCYYVYLSSSWKTWPDSRQECIKMGADLVTIDSEDEQELLFLLLQSGQLGVH
ncbi:C-type lectin domain family 1 member B-like, partial [Scleropages formosus]